MVNSALTFLYGLLWKNTTRRPWTYVMRQWSQQNRTLRGILSAIWVGFALWANMVADDWLRLGTGVMLLIGAGVWSHLYWDTKGAHVKHPPDFSRWSIEGEIDYHDAGTKADPKAFGQREHDYQPRAKGDINTYDSDD